jgi:formylglycine-generating enzyme required for sulfatase activity/serine/threonine protein kinase
MAADEPVPAGDAIEIFAAWLARRQGGELVEFDELLRGHPQHASELAELQATWKRLAAANNPSQASHSLQERIRSRFGADSVPAVSLQEAAEAETRSDFSSLLIAQVAAHSTGFGRYRIRGEVARGGMGVILKIWDEDLRRHLAMKMILGKAEAPAGDATPPIDPTRVARFLEEAQVTGQLDHPGIVPVHELGLDPEGRLYFTMKLVKGRSLKEVFDLVAEGKEGWTQTKALGVLLKVCEAMAYAHDKGVIHRDLKPANIMVGKFGEVHVMDWGLARILDQPDAKDIRIRTETARSTELRSHREEHRGQAPESPLYTMDGDVVGTPAYMPPEQAAGRLDQVGPHSDVYALGAMLYHLLAGHMPYLPKGAKLNNYAIWALVQQSPPLPIAQLSRDTPAELLAICDKAMARDWRQRYRDMSELAADLSACLEHRVVGAYETGRWAETKKWVERNRPLAASIAAGVLLLAGGLTVSLFLKARSDANAALAMKTMNEVLSLSAIQELKELVEQADALWPAVPEMVPQYDQWLAEARLLVDGSPAHPGLKDHQAKLAELRQRARPITPGQLERDQRAHPRFAEYAQAQARLTWMRRMLGDEPWPSEAEVEAALAKDALPADATALNNLAWPLVDPDPTKVLYGREVEALILARRSVAAAEEPVSSGFREALAWALYRCGRPEQALEEMQRAVDDAQGLLKELMERSWTSMQEHVSLWAPGEPRSRQIDEAASLAASVVDLKRDASERRTFEFEDAQDRWWHLQLAQLVDGLKAFTDEETGLDSDGVSESHGWGIAKRVDFARTIEARSVSGEDASRRWSAAIDAIASSPKYGGLALTPQFGLLPVGADPDSGLWEFWHLQSGDEPQRGADGKLALTGSMGIVLVLIPGGAFWMGAQKDDPAGRNYDPATNADTSPVHEVTLSPYFLSKYEMTQGQWEHVSGTNPSTIRPGFYSTGWNRAGKDWSGLQPVEQVSWADCMETLERLGLSLPSEAQWEAGCRAGTSTPWWSGAERESLQGVANLGDSYAKSHGFDFLPLWESWLDDGQSVHSEVGTYRANAFGLHDTHGNVSEWCRDGYESEYYGQSPERDPLREATGAASAGRVVRGGSYSVPASLAHSAHRTGGTPEVRTGSLGLRPARGITPHTR